MNKIILLFIIVIVWPLFSYSQPITIQGDVILSDADVVSLASFNKDTILGISNDGNVYSFIIRSTDGGKHFSTILRENINTPLRYIIIFDGTTAIAVGSCERYMRTTDAGVTWTEIFYAGGFNIYSVNQRDSSSVYLGGSLGKYWETHDKGLTWSVNSVGPYVDIYGIQWLDNDTGYVGTSNGLYYTTTGGPPYTLRNGPIGILTKCMYWKDVLHGMIGSGNYYLTNDGGYTWTTGTDTVKMGRMQILNDTTLYCFNVGYAHDIFRSLDAGVTWETVVTNSNEISSFYFFDYAHGYYSTSNYIQYSTDTGITWTGCLSSLPLINGGGFCYNDKVLQKDSLYYYYGNYAVPKINNSSQTSDYINQLSNSYTNDFIDASSGFYVHNNGSLYFFSDTGNVTDFRSTTSDASMIAFDSLHVLMRTDLLSSIDGGRTFNPLMSGIHGSQIQKVDSLTGFAFSDVNLFRTIDGGATWTNRTLSSIYRNGNFYDSLHGLLFDQQFNNVAITNDGGITLIPITLPTNFFYVFRINMTDIIYSKNNDTLYLSKDMGQNFIPILPGWVNTGVYPYLSSNGTLFLKGYCFLMANVQFNGSITLGTNSNIAENEIITYPNPANNFLYIKFKDQINACSYRISDLAGRILMNGKINISDERQISIERLKEGCYILSVTGGEVKYQTKFIKASDLK